MRGFQTDGKPSWQKLNFSSARLTGSWLGLGLKENGKWERGLRKIIYSGFLNENIEPSSWNQLVLSHSPTPNSKFLVSSGFAFRSLQLLRGKFQQNIPRLEDLKTSSPVLLQTPKHMLWFQVADCTGKGSSSSICLLLTLLQQRLLLKRRRCWSLVYMLKIWCVCCLASKAKSSLEVKHEQVWP